MFFLRSKKRLWHRRSEGLQAVLTFQPQNHLVILLFYFHKLSNYFNFHAVLTMHWFNVATFQPQNHLVISLFYFHKLYNYFNFQAVLTMRRFNVATFQPQD